VQRHAGRFSWEITVGAGTAAKVGFHGATPTAQRAGANQAAVTYASQTISDLPLFEWDAPKFAIQVGLKVQPRMLHQEVSLQDVAKITHPIYLRAYRPLGPANLTANGDGVAPTYSSGQSGMALKQGLEFSRCVFSAKRGRDAAPL
jgi:hypothetical protein